MPDKLVWQAGIEYGLQALAELKNKGKQFVCFLADEGPALESVAFAVHQLDLSGEVKFVKDVQKHISAADAILLPRVSPLEQETIGGFLRQGKTVITSDPAISSAPPRLISFPRRQWQSLVEKIPS